MKIAYVCYQTTNNTFNGVTNYEDGELSAFLQSKGLTVTTVVWHDQTINWQDYQAVILKSPWDYHQNITEFYQWLDMLSTQDIKVFNPVDIIKWNSNKRYLAEIEAAGLPIIQTLYLDQGDKLNQDTALFSDLASDKIVIKPCVSAGAHNTFIVNKADCSEYLPRINELLQDADYMAQPFAEEIINEGEWSFLFFAGKYSHAVLKVPKTGDFRVQHTHGGSIQRPAVSEDIIAQVTPFATQFAKGTLYARVDGVISEGQFKLMELELIEPFLFLNDHSEVDKNTKQAKQTDNTETRITNTENMEKYYQALLEFIIN